MTINMNVVRISSTFNYTWNVLNFLNYYMYIPGLRSMYKYKYKLNINTKILNDNVESMWLKFPQLVYLEYKIIE